jgi:small conductance mechanosensitive channel
VVLWSITIAGTITALERFFPVTAFLAGLGIIGFTVGFALQDIMKNFASGVILLLQQPFHVGETIGVKGFDGTVLAIDLRATEIKAADGRVVILPNADVLANPCRMPPSRAWCGRLSWTPFKAFRDLCPSRSLSSSLTV